MVNKIISQTVEKNICIDLVVQTFTILQIMAQNEITTITQLSKSTGIVASKIYRILQTLVSIEYVYKNQYDCYGLTLKLVNLSNSILKHFEITQKSYPFMKELSDITQETVHLAKEQEHEIVYIGKVDSPHALRLHSHIGKAAPIYCTALGKVIFAQFPQPYIEKIVKEINWVLFTKNTLPSPIEFLQELDIIRNLGYSQDNAEHVEYMHCYGAPIFDYTGSCIAAISVSIPIIRWTEEKANSIFIPELLRISKDISKLFGHIY